MNIDSIDAGKYYIKKLNLKLKNKLVKMSDEKTFSPPCIICLKTLHYTKNGNVERLRLIAGMRSQEMNK